MARKLWITCVAGATAAPLGLCPAPGLLGLVSAQLGDQPMQRILAFTAATILFAGAAFAATPANQSALEQSFDASIQPDEMSGWR